MPNDSLSQLARLAQPQSAEQFLPQQSIPPVQQQFSGWEGTGGKVAGLAANFLSGISRGRAIAFARSEQQRSQAEKALMVSIQQISTSNLPDSVKQAKQSEMMNLMGHVMLDHLNGPGGDKKKKGAGPQSQTSGNRDPEHPGHHVLSAMKNILEGMVGPGAQKMDVSPDQILAKTGEISKLIGDENNSVQAKVQGIDTQLQKRYQELGGPNGEPPTLDQLNSDPAWNRVSGAAAAITGGQATPFQNQLAAAQKERLEREKEAPVAEEKKAAATRSIAESHAAEALAGQRKQETENLKNQGPLGSLKVTGNLERSINRSKILSAAPGTYPDYIVKGAKEDQKSADQEAKAKETRITIAEQKLGESAAGPHAEKGSTVAYVPGGKSIANPTGDLAVDTMAWEFINTGHVPFTGLGSGKEGKNKREASLGRVGEILKDANLSPSDLPALRGALKSETQALGKVTSMGALVKQFEGTLLRNTDLAKKLSSEYQRGEVQIYNKVLNAFKTGVGDTEALNLAAQIHGMSREWAKIMAGQTSSAGVGITEAKDTDALISKALGNRELNSLIDKVIKPDTENRTAAIEEQRQSLVQQLQQGLGQLKPSGGPPSNGSNQTSGSPPPKSTKPGPPSGKPKTAEEYLKSIGHQ